MGREGNSSLTSRTGPRQYRQLCLALSGTPGTFFKSSSVASFFTPKICRHWWGACRCVSGSRGWNEAW